MEVIAVHGPDLGLFGVFQTCEEAVKQLTDREFGADSSYWLPHRILSKSGNKVIPLLAAMIAEHYSKIEPFLTDYIEGILSHSSDGLHTKYDLGFTVWICIFNT